MIQSDRVRNLIRFASLYIVNQREAFICSTEVLNLIDEAITNIFINIYAAKVLFKVSFCPRVIE